MNKLETYEKIYFTIATISTIIIIIALILFVSRDFTKEIEPDKIFEKGK